MVLTVKLISIVIIIWGCFVILRPSILKKVIDWIKQEKRIYLVGIIRGALGIFLVIASPLCRGPRVVLFLGALAVFSGILVFVIKESVIEKILAWWESAPIRYVYMAGTLILLIGVLLTLAA